MRIPLTSPAAGLKRRISSKRAVPERGSSLRRLQGSTLMIALIVTALVGFTMAAYLGLLGAQNHTTMRSQAWNSSIPVIEAGCEDALAHLSVHGKSNLLCDGWVFKDNQYRMSRYVENESFYTVGISNFPGSPVIYSFGYVEIPGLVSTGVNPIYALAGGNLTMKKDIKTYLVRGVRLSARRAGIFVKAMIAKNTISVSDGVLTDSFDSSNPLYSTNGFYTSSKRRDNGDIATNSKQFKAINTSGGVKIYGHISTGPGGTVGQSGTASIGDKPWVDVPTSGIKDGWFRDDMNMAFADVSVPFTGGYFAPSPGLVGGTNYAYVLTSGNYQKDGNLNLNAVAANTTNRVMVTGHAVLYVTGNVNFSGAAGIIIAPGGSLKLYVGGTTATLSGAGVMNGTGFATNFVYYGLPGNLNVNLSGGTAFTGLIYAPEARLTLSGGSVVYGASISESVFGSGGFSFHYDESLGSFGTVTPYVVTSWNEMTPAEVGGLVVSMVPPPK